MADGTEEELAEWYQHPQTVRFKSLIEGQASGAKAVLKQACLNSSDPVVRAAYAELGRCEIVLAGLAPAKKETARDRR